MKHLLTFLLISTLAFQYGCDNLGQVGSTSLAIRSENFGDISGQAVRLWTLTNRHGITVRITNYGGRVVGISTPDQDGQFADIVLGFRNAEKYAADTYHFGGIIGRYAGVIAEGRFTLNDHLYQLTQNENLNHFNGGARGFDTVIWDADTKSDSSAVALILKYVSPDGEEGYPGNLTTQVTYSLNNQDEFRIDYFAKTDKPTVVNLTNQIYFNLQDGGATSATAHLLRINADEFLPIDSNKIPWGASKDVRRTPFDFRSLIAVRTRIHEDDDQIQYVGGYDHNYVLNKKADELSLAAVLFSPASGRVLQVFTTEPGLHFYSGNNIHGVEGKSKVFEQNAGLCLEPLHFADSPNQSQFPTTALEPGEEYLSSTLMKFTYEGAHPLELTDKSPR